MGYFSIFFTRCLTFFLMKENLSDYREEYGKFSLLENSIIGLTPMELFKKWFEEIKGEVEEPNAMVLSTIGEDGGPDSRVVLLKEFNKEGFIFYTNYGSKKAKAIDKNKKVSLCFFWPFFQRQVIIKGKVSQLEDEKSSRYFLSRPINSQIAAWASKQSQVANSREHIEERYQSKKEYFSAHPIKKPPFWGGYLIKPYEMEFWQGRKNRLHDRLCFYLKDNTWELSRLFP